MSMHLTLPLLAVYFVWSVVTLDPLPPHLSHLINCQKMLSLDGNYNVTVMGTKYPKVTGCAHHPHTESDWGPGMHLSLGMVEHGGVGYCGKNTGEFEDYRFNCIPSHTEWPYTFVILQDINIEGSSSYHCAAFRLDFTMKKKIEIAIANSTRCDLLKNALIEPYQTVAKNQTVNNEGILLILLEHIDGLRDTGYPSVYSDMKNTEKSKNSDKQKNTKIQNNTEIVKELESLLQKYREETQKNLDKQENTEIQKNTEIVKDFESLLQKLKEENLKNLDKQEITKLQEVTETPYELEKRLREIQKEKLEEFEEPNEESKENTIYIPNAYWTGIRMWK